MITQKKLRTRAKIRATASRPRLSVYKSNKYIYAQIIDDVKGVTMASAKGTKPIEVGVEIAKKSIAKKIKLVVFDRGAYKYHGKVKALAESAREGGLEF